MNLEMKEIILKAIVGAVGLAASWVLGVVATYLRTKKKINLENQDLEKADRAIKTGIAGAAEWARKTWIQTPEGQPVQPTGEMKLGKAIEIAVEKHPPLARLPKSSLATDIDAQLNLMRGTLSLPPTSGSIPPGDAGKTHLSGVSQFEALKPARTPSDVFPVEEQATSPLPPPKAR